MAEQWIEELKEQYKGRARVSIPVACTILGIEKSALYDLLGDGHLQAHAKEGKPGKKGVMILAHSVWSYLERGVIPAAEWGRHRFGIKQGESE